MVGVLFVTSVLREVLRRVIINRRLVITIAAAVLCTGLLFAARNILQRIGVSPIFLTGGIGAVLVGAWIYMVWMVWRKRIKISHDQMDTEIAERRYKILKVSMLAAGVFLLVGIIGTVVHNALYIPLGETEEPVSFFFAIAGLSGFVAATAGGWIFYFMVRKAT